MVGRTIRNIILIFLGGLMQMISMALSVMIGLALYLPIALVSRNLMNKVNPQNIFELLLSWLPFFLIMLCVYAVIWYFMNQWAYKENFKSMWFHLGAMILNASILLFVYMQTKDLYAFLSIWNDDSCGMIPLQFVFLCTLYSIFLLPAYGWGLQHWILPTPNKQRRKRWLHLIGGLGCILCVFILLTILVL